jgi:hypothetical protein
VEHSNTAAHVSDTRHKHNTTAHVSVTRHGHNTTLSYHSGAIVSGSASSPADLSGAVWFAYRTSVNTRGLAFPFESVWKTTRRLETTVGTPSSDFNGL